MQKFACKIAKIIIITVIKYPCLRRFIFFRLAVVLTAHSQTLQKMIQLWVERCLTLPNWI